MFIAERARRCNSAQTLRYRCCNMQALPFGRRRPQRLRVAGRPRRRLDGTVRSGTAIEDGGEIELSSGRPRPAKARLDIRTNHASHDLRGSEVLLGTKSLEQRFLARIDQGRQARRALLEVNDSGDLHLHANYIVG